MLAIALMMAISTPLLGDAPVEDAYDLGEVTITCSGKGYGRCYYPEYMWEESAHLFGEYYCMATGDPRNHCSHLYIKIVNFVYLNWLT